MRLFLERFAYHPDGTLGRIQLPQCRLFTIERPWAQNQPFVSCIPEGLYRCARITSPRFGETFEVTGVPGRSHILFHAANRASELEGCIAPGMALYAAVDVGQSRIAMAQLMASLEGLAGFDLVVRSWRPDYQQGERQ